jgi:hypothetical protein
MKPVPPVRKIFIPRSPDAFMCILETAFSARSLQGRIVSNLRLRPVVAYATLTVVDRIAPPAAKPVVRVNVRFGGAATIGGKAKLGA